MRSARPPRRSSRTNSYTSLLAIATATVTLLPLLLLLTATPALAATCLRPQKALTSECNRLCQSFHPCVIIDDALDRDWTCGNAPLSNLSTCVARVVDPCHYECFAVDSARPQNYSTFAFFVPFGAWRSAYDRESASGSTAAAWTQQVAALSTVKLNESVSWKNNDDVQRIDWLDLPTTCTDVVLAGGTSEQSLKGKVASVALASDLLRNNTFVTGVRLVNLDLADAALTLAAMLPASQLVALTLVNTLLTAVPANLKSLKQLLSLDLQWNFISAVTADDSLATLLHLNLHGNAIANFTAAMPKLQTLNLSANALTEIPSAIFDMPRLTTLSLDANPLVVPELSTTQFAFLKALATLTLPTITSAPPCATAQQMQLGSATICVLDDAAVAEKKKNQDTASKSETAESSSPAALIGAIAGSVVVLGAVVCGVVVWRRKRSSGSSGTSATSKRESVDDAYAHDRTPTIMTERHNSGSGPTGHRASTGNNNSQIAKSSTKGIHGTNNSNSSNAAATTATFLSVWNDPDLLAIQLRFDDIEDLKVVGTGAFGVVWLVRYRGTQLLASKRLKPGETDRARMQAFIDEIKLVSTLEHPNIVKFIGAAWTQASDLQALFEYLDRGDLKSYLLEETTPQHWTQEKLQIAVDVAEALVYVHSFTPALVHRDLKARNVLLTTDLRAKLTDFGVSRYQSDNNTMTAGVGTAKWLAPEVISGLGDYGAAADMYSFGVVLSELDTHASPFSDARSATGNVLPEIAVLQLVARGELTPSFSHACPDSIRALAMRCLAFESSKRPSAVEVAYQLRTMQKSLYASL